MAVASPDVDVVWRCLPRLARSPTRGLSRGRGVSLIIYHPHRASETSYGKSPKGSGMLSSIARRKSPKGSACLEEVGHRKSPKGSEGMSVTGRAANRPTIWEQLVRRSAVHAHASYPTSRTLTTPPTVACGVAFEAARVWRLPPLMSTYRHRHAISTAHAHVFLSA